MASVQAQVFENNEWVTRTITTDELISPPAPVHRMPPALPSTPQYGVLTKTIIESPITRWVLPVQLRSSRFNDVALVGDQYVQIYELGADTELRPIAKRIDFGAKIRNCLVMGTQNYLSGLRQDIHARYYRNGDVDMASASPSASTSLPNEADIFQQILVLVLDEDVVFLFMHQTASGDWQFFEIYRTISARRLVDPGFHAAISPDGGYLALASSENLFIVYQLESMDELRRQFKENSCVQPVRFELCRGIRGVIINMEFLHTGTPGTESASHVVLLIMTVHSEVVRLATYEWEKWEALQDALEKERPGHRLDAAAGLPLLVVPLTVRCQFIIITEHSMAICSDVLAGPPVFAPFELRYRPASDWHLGSRAPLWTAWTRPPREGSYHTDTDLIYLAREDGWVNCLEIRGDSGIETSISMGPLECNIDSGFASLSIPYGELLVVGGGYNPGSTWSVVARQEPKRIGSLPNWSPTTDLVLLSETSRYLKSDSGVPAKQPAAFEEIQNHVLPPDRIFACSGRGLSGAIIELRSGIEAKIGLDLSYPTPIKRCWAVPSFDATSEAGFFMLLALPHSSALLHISHDFSEVTERVQNEVKFDLLSTTLAVQVLQDTIIQITTTHATIVSPTGCYQHLISHMIKGLQDPLATVTDAVMMNTILALSVYSHSAFKIIVFILDENKFAENHVLDVEGEVTALAVHTLSAGICVLAGLSLGPSGPATLKIFPIKSSLLIERAGDDAQQNNTPRSRSPTRLAGMFAAFMPVDIKLDVGENPETTSVNAVTSIICHGDKMLIGMRDGAVLTIQPIADEQTGEVFEIDRTNYFGVSSSHVFKGMVVDNKCASTLVCNDAGLALIKEAKAKGKRSLGYFEKIFRVWLTDANEPHLQSPTVNSVAPLRDIPEYDDSTWAMVAGSHILIAQLQPRPAPIPRYLPTGGTPSGILYSERLEALVTIIVKKGIPSLHFFDPATGADLSHPVKKMAQQADVDVEYITNLGNPDIKVVSLLDWSYSDKGKLYEWFVLLTKWKENQGRLLVISAEQEVAVTNSGITRQIRFWAQFQRKFKDRPLRCGATDSNGVFLGFGNTVEYHIIERKKFVTYLKYDLPSPPTCLEVVSSTYLHVLTTHHSLVVLNYSCDAARNSGRMVLASRDGSTRNGLHSIDAGYLINIREPQHLILTSTLLCGVHGLWSPGETIYTPELKTLFTADLTKSVRKFVHGYTRPRWAKDATRYGRLSRLYRGGILGLAIDGSLTEFVILSEDMWRLLRYIQSLVIASKEIYFHAIARIARDRAYYNNIGSSSSSSRRRSIGDIGQLDLLDSAVPTNMHVDGDFLQLCLEKKMLPRIVSTPAELARLQALLEAVYLPSDDGTGTGTGKGKGTGTAAPSPITTETVLATYERTYDILEYYLSPAL
ncbi:hypothetical protein F5Y14DRAFT_416625 [Nemania sp. NC0429]|nr:hypothetical protein F5Y14DRAFT_416625 [Nemania sp. NC0429]